MWTPDQVGLTVGKLLLIRPIACLLAVMAVCAVIAGVLGWMLARAGAVYLLDPIAQAVPREKHAAYLADLWAHNASYGIGFVGGLVLSAWVWWSRGRRAAG
jgi:hypothetical protein